MDNRLKPVFNGVAFQLNWFSCILLGGHWAVLTTVLLLIFHAAFISRKTMEWLLIGIFSLTGFLCDSVIMWLGFIEFSNPLSLTRFDISPLFAPLWLYLLWVSFATCLCHSLKFFYHKKFIILIICFTIIPLNYYLGAKLTGAIFFPPMFIPLLMIALYWQLILPVGLSLASKINQESK